MESLPGRGAGAHAAGRVMGEAKPQSRGWLFGSTPDLMLGCGAGSMLVMVAQATLGGDALEAWVPGALLILVFALPHYGATLVRVYEDATDRQKYRVFSLWATLAVAAAFVATLYGHWLGSLLLTIYLTWSPWHYTGQNYGIALMLAARRGVAVEPLAKRLVYASFVSSFLLTFFAIHSARPEGTYAPVSYGGTVFELMPLGIPHALVGVAIAGIGAVYAATTLAAVVLLVRRGGLVAYLPSLLLMATQALWFTVPVPVRHWQLAGEGSAFLSIYTAYGFLWIAGYHAVQYLWITTYYGSESPAAVRQQPVAWRRRTAFLGKSALAGYAVWTLPALVFAPGLLGQLPHESGLALMIAAMVNVHHFILDGAVWKLRDGRVARILLRSGPAPETAALAAEPVRAAPRTPWLRRGLQAAGAVCVVYGAFTFWVEDFGFSRALAGGRIDEARAAVEQLSWLGRDGPSRRTELGRRMAREGDLEGARAEFERSLALAPTARGYQSLGLLHEQSGEWQLAATAYDSALALEPDDLGVLFRAGRAWLESGRPDRAVPLLVRAAGLAPDDGRIASSLARARREIAAHPRS